ncbi:MAG: DNA/RNA non-specific endonuclease [Flavobacteriaceae bacterium]|nr:DNA/RNA non-specific endonuclease [Flavobacteriaceae bacterium]
MSPKNLITLFFHRKGLLILFVIFTFCNASDSNPQTDITRLENQSNQLVPTQTGSQNTSETETSAQNNDSNAEDNDNSDDGNNTHSESKNSEQKTKNEDYLIEGPIFRVSYNEIKEQPNWLEYIIRPNLRATTSRDGRNFYDVDSVHTSDDDDYYKNVWDKGHLAPAAAFIDSDFYMHESFSYLNCTLQHQSLNRGQWAVLEGELRKRANQYQKRVCVRIELIFDDQSITLPTDAVVPSGYIKYSYIEGVGQECYQFENKKPLGSWREQVIDCPKDIGCYNPK